MPQPHVQVVLGANNVPQPLEAALRRTGARASFRPLSEALRGGLSPSADAIVVIAPDDAREVGDRLRVLFDRMADQPRATLVLKRDGRFMPQVAHPPSVPVTFGTGLDEEELTVRLSTMVDMRDSLECLHRGMMATNLSEETATKRYINQLRLASQVQREFLPEGLPRYGPVSLSALYRPVDYVSGDIYDIQRLDEDHIGIALADATGHGIPAALLTVFIKRALRGKEVENGAYRLLPPDEVLRRLNADVLEANLAECRFVAATYAILNIQTLELSIARGGSPYPILRKADGTIRLIRPHGGVVGVMPEATFAVETVQMERGDALIAYSDGLEKLIVPQLPANALAETFTRAADMISGRQSTTRDAGRSDLRRATNSLRAASAVSTASGQAVGVSPEAVTGAAVAEVDETADPPETAETGDGPSMLGGSDGFTDEHCRRLCPPGHCVSREGDSLAASGCPSTPPDEEITQSLWYDILRDEGAARALDQLTIRFDMLRRIGHPLDDLTVVAVQIDP